MKQHESILRLTKELVKIPTQTGINSCDAIIDFLISWGKENDVVFQKLQYENKTVGLLLEIKGDLEGPLYCFDACLDTAPAGNTEFWDFAPFAALENDGWLFGRGTGDSKVAIAIFLHIIKELIGMASQMRGTVHFLFDAEEHSGRFLGIKSYVSNFPPPQGVYIGYPGNKSICIGARGFYRTKLTFYGVSEHSGATVPTNKNPINIASEFIQMVNNIDSSSYYDPDLGKEPQFSITKILSGNSFSVIPSECEVYLDVRLNDILNLKKAKEIVLTIIKEVEEEFSSPKATRIEDEESWPAYKLSKSETIVKILLDSAKEQLSYEPELKIAGPSNIGNYLASVKIPAICGFGVEVENIHASNERIRIDTVDDIFSIYLNTAKKLLRINS